MRLRSYAGLLAVALLSTAMLTGCQTLKEHNTTANEPAYYNAGNQPPAPVTHTQAPAPAPAPQPQAKPAPVSTGGLAIPTTYKDSSVLYIERIGPSQVAQGQPYESRIRVTNLTDQYVRNVVISDEIASNYKFVSASPKASSNKGNVLKWNLGTFTPNQVKVIKLKGAATSTKAVENCLSGVYELAFCNTVAVTNPKLSLTVASPAQQLECDPLSVIYIVTNTGTGTANDVVINAPLPEGVTTKDGKNNVEIKAGDLAAGQARKATIALNANQGGKYTFSASAKSSEGLKAKASDKTTLLEPKLTIKCSLPNKQIIGRSVTYKATISNTGNGNAKRSVAKITLPSGSKLASSSTGGVLKNGVVTWNLGTIAVGAEKEISVTVNTHAAADLDFATTADAYCAPKVNCNDTVKVVGIPAILLEVVDVHDPIEVGHNETYIITITNQGTAPDTGIITKVGLEDGMQYVSSTGQTKGTVSADGKTITFAPVSSLAPKAEVSWKVVIKATKARNVRFHTQITSDNLTRPVLETESTNFYK